MSTASFHSLGCRLNQTEAAVLAGAFKAKGYEIVDWGVPADLVVINTCSVTERGEAACRSAIRQALRRQPEAFVVVTGCYAQVGLEALRAIEGIDMIVGTQYKDKFPAFIGEPRKLADPVVLHSSLIDDSDFEIAATGHYHTTRANLKVQDGCDFFCSFCIIPFTRGRERSRKLSDLLHEARELAAGGYQELVLTGVNIGRYQQGGETFEGMIRRLEEIESLRRIRITSIEPTTIERSLVDHMARSEKLCNYFHIPIQSASDTVLENMNRRYTGEQFRDFLDYVVETVPDVGLGTDVIVGFPGETDAVFEQTYRYLESLPFAYFHVFSYSKRYGTKAARLGEHVGSQAIKERSFALRTLSSQKRREFNRRYLGERVEVLFEQQDDAGLWTGLTGNYMRVGAVSSEPLRNQIREVTISELSDDGELALGCVRSSATNGVRTVDPLPSPVWETEESPHSEPPHLP